MAIGVPGWPELARWTASIASVRMVLMQSWSIDCWIAVALIVPPRRAATRVRSVVADRARSGDLFEGERVGRPAGRRAVNGIKREPGRVRHAQAPLPAGTG